MTECKVFEDGGFAIIAGDEIVPIVAWFDDLGEDCHPYNAVAATAGPTAAGQWIAIAIQPQDRTRLH